jgi:hypothetical protein
MVVRDAVESGRLAGPRFYAAAPALHVNSAPNAEAARAAVAAAQAAGYDLIKSHQIVDPAIWQAVQDEARRVGIPTAGHVTNPVGLSALQARDSRSSISTASSTRCFRRMRPSGRCPSTRSRRATSCWR